MIPTNQGAMTPERIVDSLTYSCYRHNRALGMSAERLKRLLWPQSGDALEARYQREITAGAQ